jgi:hypothetical protein
MTDNVAELIEAPRSTRILAQARAETNERFARYKAANIDTLGAATLPPERGVPVTFTNIITPEAPSGADLQRVVAEHLRIAGADRHERAQAAAIMSDSLLWTDIGPKLTCIEAEALGVLLVAAGARPNQIANIIISQHGSHDDEGDAHWHQYASALLLQALE